jgi:hypothetical protein
MSDGGMTASPKQTAAHISQVQFTDEGLDGQVRQSRWWNDAQALTELAGHINIEF